MKPRTLPRILLAAVLGGAALSYLMTGMAVSEAANIQPPDSPIDSPLRQQGTTPSRTQTDPAPPGTDVPPPTAVKPSPEQAAEHGQPGENHEYLDRLVGDWDLTIRVWSSPDGEPIESAGTAEARWILGDRFLWTIYRAELFGKPFEAWSIEGYDNQARQYVGTWRDTQGTYTLIYTGTCQQPPQVEGEKKAEKAAKATTPPVPDCTFRVMSTRLTDPVSGEALDVRTELRITEDGDGFVQESFVVLSAEESIKNLELTGRRRGGS